MKLLKSFHFQLILIATIMCCILWLLGPHITIYGKMPLANKNTLMLITIVIFVLCGLSLVTYQQIKILKKLSTSKAGWQNEQQQAILKIIQQNFKVAKQFLRKFKKQALVPRLPWYLVIGPENSGKTSLLTHGDLGIVSVDNQPVINSNRTQYCDWWFAKDAVFVDTSGSLLIQKDTKTNPNPIWLGLIKLLGNYCYRRFIKGVMIIIDINEFQLQDREQQQLQINSIRHHLQALTKYVEQYPIYLILSKCDRIAGFSEFFHDMDINERHQACGISLPFGITLQNFNQTFHKQFDTFLQRLNEQLIWHMHQERNLTKRALIKDFPLQLESQKAVIEQIAASIHSEKTSLSGIYFTSSMHDGNQTDYLMVPLTQAFNLKQQTLAVRHPQDKTYFIKDTLKKIINNNQLTLTSYRYWYNSKFYMASTVLALIISLIFIVNYQRDIHALKSIKAGFASLTKYSVSTGQSNPLSTLNALANAREQLYKSKIALLSFSSTHKFRDQLDKSYLHQLNTQFAPQLQTILASQIQAYSSNNPEQLFNTLKVYLMLSDSSQFNKNIVKTWFANYWKQAFQNDVATQKQLEHHLAVLLNHPMQISLDQSLVNNARQSLSKLGLPQLTYLLLKDKYPKTKIQMINNSSIFTDSSGSTISELYLAKNFNDIYYQTIPSICQQMNAKNWVLAQSIKTVRFIT